MWIAVLSYGMVLLVERFGCIVGINQYVMGLVVVAAGTSVPVSLTMVGWLVGWFNYGLLVG